MEYVKGIIAIVRNAGTLSVTRSQRICNGAQEREGTAGHGRAEHRQNRAESCATQLFMCHLFVEVTVHVPSVCHNAVKHDNQRTFTMLAIIMEPTMMRAGPTA